MKCSSKNYLNDIPIKCDSCGSDNTCGCKSKVDTEKCTVCHSTIRSYQHSVIVNEDLTYQKLNGPGYKVFDFLPEENNEKSGIDMETSSCGKHPIVYDCTKQPIMKEAFKTCTMNEMYFDPETCEYQYLYRFLGIPDTGDDNDMPIGNGGTDVFMKFLHPRYDLRVRLGLYETDLNLEPIKRDAGRVIHACLHTLISNGTRDEITITPSGDGGMMAESDFFRIAQLLTYKDNDYDDYGIVENRPQNTRTKEPPITYYKVKLCPSDADILCLGDSVDESELNGYMIYEAKPYSKNDNDSDGNSDWFYKLTFVLENGREFWFYSSSTSIEDGCRSNTTVCVGDGSNVFEDTTCGKSISGCNLSVNSSEKKCYVGSGCLMINGTYRTITNTQVFTVSDVDHMTFVWAEKVTDSCGTSVIELKSREVAYKTSAMLDLGADIYDNRNDIIPIAAFQYVPPGSASNAMIPINDYRQQIDLNEVYYVQQYSTYSAVKKFDISFFGTVDSFNCDYQFSNSNTSVSHDELGVKVVGNEVSRDSYRIQERGTLIGATGDVNNDNNYTSFLNKRVGLGYCGSSNGSKTSVSGSLFFDTNQGLSITSQSSSPDYLAGLYGVSTQIGPLSGSSVQPDSVSRVEFDSIDDFYNEVHIQSQGRVTSGTLPIFFIGVQQQD